MTMAALSPTSIAIGAGVLVAAVLLLSGGERVDKHLKERVLSVREVKTREMAVEGAVMLDDEGKQTSLLRLVHWLGYRSDLPAPYGASLKVVIPVSVVVGLLVFKLFGMVTSALPALALGAVVALGAASIQFRRKNAAYRTALFRQVPDTLSLMLRAVRAGLPVPEAIKSVSRESLSPTREEFGRVAAEAALGMQTDLTLRRLFERTGLQEYAFFAVVIGLNGQTGGNLAETIENLADTVRKRVTMAAKAKALSAEGRLSAVLVGALPFGVGGLTAIVNPDYMMEFLTPGGRVLIVAFVVLLTIGLSITQWLVKRSTAD